MIQIYGSPRTSASRCILMLEELGLPYQQMPLDMSERREHKSDAYLKLNPNGKVPCLVDGDFVIWESIAINHYLAEKYRPELVGTTVEERGRSMQWSTWAMVELQQPLVGIIIQTMFTPEDKRDAGVLKKAQEHVPHLLGILDQHLARHEHLAGARLTVADFNMVTVINLASHLKFPLEPYKNIQAWFARMKARPAFTKLMQLRTS